MNRREFVRTAGGVTGGAAALGGAGAAAGQDGGNATDGAGNGTAGGGGGNQDLPEPDYGGWFSDVANFEGTTVNALNQDTVEVAVGAEGNGGNFAFAPPAIHVSNGTTVRWRWTGEGGGHNVVSDGDGPLDSGDLVSSEGVHYEYTFQNDGIYRYVCEPHETTGMKGAVVVGTDYASIDPGGVVTLNPEEAGVPIQPHFVGIGTGLMVVVSLIYSFFVLKYGESAHTSGGND